MEQKKQRRTFLLAAAIAVIVAAIAVLSNDGDDAAIIAPTVQGKDTGVNVGQKAPDFTLQTATGEAVSLSDFRGKPVLVNFWASWCPFCVDELPDLQKAFEETNVVVLGINRGESKEAARAYLENELPVEVTFPLLYDTQETVSRVYIITGMPVSYFIDSDGIIRDRKFGPMQADEIRQRLAKLTGAEEAKEENRSSDLLQSGSEVRITDGTRHTVPLDSILQGCFGGKDCIPSIDEPKFTSATDADAWLDDEEHVLGIVIDGDARAYPIHIMDWHEIVNDDIAGNPIAITYCPLCGTGIAYERIINGKATEFGVSGKLHNSDLVMYDRSTETYWSQITGEGIVGELAGRQLRAVPLDTATWSGWKQAYPETKVLTRDTGYSRPYGSYPYGDYQESRSVNFPVDNRDDRLHPKEWVHGIIINETATAFKETAVREAGVINALVGQTPVAVVYDARTGSVRVFERTHEDNMLIFSGAEGGMKDQHGVWWSYEGTQDGFMLKQIPTVRSFWFAWVAFYPKTELRH